MKNIMLGALVFVAAGSFLPNDPEFKNQWAFQNRAQKDNRGLLGVQGLDIGLLPVVREMQGRELLKKIRVAVIDTGVDYHHSDLSASMWKNTVELYGVKGVDDDQNGFIDDVYGYDFANNDGDPMDDHRHGTHCAGTIGAMLNNEKGGIGIAQSVEIIAIKALDHEGRGYTNNLIQAINYAVQMGAQIISASWGGVESTPEFESLFFELEKKNIIFVAAAGNDGLDLEIEKTYPVSYHTKNLIVVASSDNSGQMWKDSNYGASIVHLAAPGVSIFSTHLRNSYSTETGTSMATPMVAGAAALLWSLHPSWNSLEIKRRLIEFVQPMSGLKGKVVSGGILDIEAADLGQEQPTHPDDPVSWQRDLSEPIETPHPYKNQTLFRWNIQIERERQVSFFFKKIRTEHDEDWIKIFNADSGDVLFQFSGYLDSYWTPFLKGKNFRIEFTSDDSTVSYGFLVPKISIR